MFGTHYDRIIPLKVKLMITFSAMISLCLLLQVGISYFFFTDMIEKKTTAYFQQTITQANSRIDASLYSYEKMTRTIIANEVIQESLRDLLKGNISQPVANKKIKEELAKITISEVNINSIQIIPKNKKTINYIFVSHYLDYEAVREMPWYQEVKESSGQLLWLPSSKLANAMIGKNNSYAFSAVRKINSLDTGDELAIMMLNIDESHLRDSIKEVKLGEQGQVYLLSRNDGIISFTDETYIGHSIKEVDINPTEDMMITDISDYTGWKLAGIVPRSEYKSQIKQLHIIFLPFSLVAIFIIILFAIAISKSIVKPITAIISAMKEVQKGNLKVHIKHKQRNELGILTDYFNQTVEEIQFFINKVYKQEISRQEAELKAIQAQLNPHFLYNTLDTIYWMLILKEEEEIGDLVVALADILRYCISNGKEFVTVEEDLSQLENYLTIQKTRFNEKLHYEFDLDPNLMNIEIPKLLLQPLVENSIYHGFCKMRREGKIMIKGYSEAEEIFFKVEDNGYGMSKEKIEAIFNGACKSDKKHTGLGLKAVHNRIALLYGEEYGIEIHSIENQGTTMIVKLKKRSCDTWDN